MSTPFLTFTFPECIIRDLLDGRGCRNICRNTAEILLMKTHNTGPLCYVQLPGNILAEETFDSVRHLPGIRDLEFAVTYRNKPITTCILWEWNYWRSSSEAWLQKKAKLKREKEIYDIYIANLRKVKRAIMRKMSLSDGVASVTAHQIVMDPDNRDALKFFGVDRLYTNIKEI